MSHEHSTPERIDLLVIGAGTDGTNTALLAQRTGLKTVIVEKEAHILAGAPQATYYQHSDGIEYHDEDHVHTGELCVEGAIVHNVLFPKAMLRSAMYNPHDVLADNMRFFVSEESNHAALNGMKEGAVSIDSFKKNALHMKQHYQTYFQHLQQQLGYNTTEMYEQFGMTPESYIRELNDTEMAYTAHTSCGYQGEGKIISMPMYYAYMKAALDKEKVEVQTRSTITSIEIIDQSDTNIILKDGYLVTLTNGQRYITRALHLSAGHKNPELVDRIPNATPCEEMRGTYYTNAMVKIKLPPTDDEQLRQHYATPGFILQGPEHGCAYTPVKAPGPIDSSNPEANWGYATLYYPDNIKGNQLESQNYNPDKPSLMPLRWDSMMVDSKRIDAIMRKAEHYYPFLKDRQQFHSVDVRTVFNASTRDNPDGEKRNIRDIPKTHPTVAPNITVGTTPKWTTGTLVALGHVHHILQSLGHEGLSHDVTQHGIGPFNLDLGAFLQRYGKIELSPSEINPADIAFYAQQQGYPADIHIPYNNRYTEPTQHSTYAVPNYRKPTISSALKSGKTPEGIAQEHSRFADAVKQSRNYELGR